MDDLEDPKTFLDYMEAHSQTERALFHKGHVVRLFSMAGQTERAKIIGQASEEWASLPNEITQPLVDKARELLSKEEVSGN